MPETSTVRRAKQDLREGKSATTAAGEFVHEEIAHVRSGQHGARSARQVIAIGLSKARRAGIPLPAPGEDAPGRETSARTRRAAQGDAEAGKMEKRTRTPATGSKNRTRAAKSALAREGHRAASHQALSAQARRGRRR
jgi:hypothetical protein